MHCCSRCWCSKKSKNFSWKFWISWI